MKRILVLLLALCLLFSFAACTRKIIQPAGRPDEPYVDDEPETEEPANDEELPTFERVADVLAVIPDSDLHRMITSTYFVCAFCYRDGITLRVVADVPAEIYQKIDALDFSDDYREIQERELIAPLPIKSVERLDSQIPTQEELDQYIGKTLPWLLASGFEMNGYSGGDESVFLYMRKGISEFEIELDGIIEESVFAADDFDDNQLIVAAYDFPVKTITFDGLAHTCLDID